MSIKYFMNKICVFANAPSELKMVRRAHHKIKKGASQKSVFLSLPHFYIYPVVSLITVTCFSFDRGEAAFAIEL